jgi:hypothetical protein
MKQMTGICASHRLNPQHFSDIPQMLPIPRKLIEFVLRRTIPLAKEVAALFAQNAEPSGRPPRLNWWIETYGVRDWAKAYLHPQSLFQAYETGLVEGRIEPLAHVDWSGVDTTNLEAIYSAIWRSVEKSLLLDKDEPELPESVEAEQQALSEMSEEERQAHIERMRKLVGASMVMVNNYFACMVYKKSMVQLVSEALKGNRKSFLRAIHVDPDCLESINYFREAMIQAAMSPTNNLVAKVQEWRQKPPLASGVTLNGLYLVFLILNLFGVMEQFKADMDRFAELCQSLGVYGPPMEEDVVDVENFAKTLRRFEKEHQVISFIPPGKLIVKDTL